MAIVENVEKEKVANYQKADTFGPKVKSIIAALSGFYKNSKREVASIINDIFNVNISVGSISNSEHRVASRCKEMYEKIEQEISKSEVLHIDETSYYNKGFPKLCEQNLRK